MAVSLSPPALALLHQVKVAGPRALAALGARLYRLQHDGGETTVLSSLEWRCVWTTYRARRAARAA